MTPSKTSDISLFRRLLGFARPYRWLLAAALLFMVATTAAEILVSVVIQRTVDSQVVNRWLVVPGPGQDSAVPQELWNIVLEAAAGDPTLVRQLEDGSRLLNSNAEGVSPEISRLAAAGTLEVYILVEKAVPAGVAAGFSLIRGADETFTAIPETVWPQLPEALRTELSTVRVAGIALNTLALLGLYFVILAATFLQTYFLTRVGQGVMKDLRIRVYSHILGFRLGYLQDKATGSLVSRVTNDVEAVNEMFTSILAAIISDVLLMVGVVAGLFVLNDRLAFITLLTLPPIFILSIIFRNQARAAYRAVRHWVSELNRFIAEHISGMAVIRAFTREQRVAAEFDEVNTTLRAKNLAEMRIFSLFRSVVDLFATISVATVLYFGARDIFEGLVSFGVLIAFVNLIRRFFDPVMDLSDKFTIMQSAMAGAERVFGLLDTSDAIPDTGTVEVPKQGIRGSIRFENVSFSYKEGTPVLKNLSLEVNPGEKVAIVGYTGAGKTSVANLLTRLWDRDSGLITIDDIPVENFKLANLRQLVQVVQQDLSLFSDTIRENILLGKSITDAELDKILEYSRAADFVSRLPAGVETVLSENASNISPGQKQLLAFARILAQNPRIIILDEATAHIDTETERLVQEGLARVLSGRTSIVIAHRLSTIRDADRILVLSHGELVESGTHDDLIARDSHYSRLSKYQFGEQVQSQT